MRREGFRINWEKRTDEISLNFPAALWWNYHFCMDCQEVIFTCFWLKKIWTVRWRLACQIKAACASYLSAVPSTQVDEDSPKICAAISFCPNPKPPIPARILLIHRPTVTPALNTHGTIAYNHDAFANMTCRRGLSEFRINWPLGVWLDRKERRFLNRTNVAKCLQRDHLCSIPYLVSIIFLTQRGRLIYFIPQKEIIVNRFENPFDRHEKNTESRNEMSCWRDRTRLSWTFTVRERKNEVYPDCPWTLWFRFWFFCPCPTSSRIIGTRGGISAIPACTDGKGLLMRIAWRLRPTGFWPWRQ